MPKSGAKGIAKKVEAVEANTTYLIEFRSGKRQRITVPSKWKVTFGPAVAGGNKGDKYGTREMPMALRFYENETQQRAIFTDVVSFRDLSILIEEEQVNIQEKQGYVECEGKRKGTTFRAETREWVNPDISSEQKLLPRIEEEKL